MATEEPVERVDAKGLLCPLPITRTAAAMRRVPDGALVELVGDDPRLLEDLPAWCEGEGHRLVSLRRDAALLIGRVRKRESPAKAQGAGDAVAER